MKDFQYQPSEDINRSIDERLRQVPREPDLLSFSVRWSVAMVIKIWLRLYHRLKIKGLEHLPKEGSFIMVANHTSHLDTLCMLDALPMALRQRAFPAAAADYFFSNFPKSLFSAMVINALPFDREKKSGDSLHLCRKLLEKPGNILILFPEGTRSKDGSIQRFRTGVGRLIVGTNTPVVPCKLDGCQRAFPKGSVLPRPTHIELWIGEPIRFNHLPVSHSSVTAIADRLQHTIETMQG